MSVLTHTNEPSRGSDADRRDTVRFCSRCGTHDDQPASRVALRRRVCATCGMGVMLTALSDALPGSAAAFLIVTDRLEVSAVSQAGEKLFGAEDLIMGAHLLDLLTSPVGDGQMEDHARRAAERRRETVSLPVRLKPAHGAAVGTLSARIAHCSSPAAALLAVEPGRFAFR
jgi:PAS domain-containing protein